jgi:serine/threonine protein kinase
MIGQTVSHYRILEELGAGGMGVVYKAEDLTLDRHVALKFLSKELGTDESAKKRFIREAKAASALEHPNICSIYEIDQAPDGRLFTVMPCYEGKTLRERLDEGPMDVDAALAIAAQVASALARAHEKGIVHRDIKPGNVMLTDGGRQAKLMDFGLVKRLDATRVTRTGMTVGTVAYMSPEQALGKETDGRTDVWSLGVMLYEMLTGRLPFRGDVEPALLYSIINQDPEPITTVRRDVPLQTETIIEKALVKNADKRYQGMGELLHDLEAAPNPETPAEVPSKAPARGGSDRGPRRGRHGRVPHQQIPASRAGGVRGKEFRRRHVLREHGRSPRPEWDRPNDH